MRESVESLQHRIAAKAQCDMPNCKLDASHRPVITLPKLEGVDKQPPRAELEFVICEPHSLVIDPLQFLSAPVRHHLENVLVKVAGRPLLNPVDWNEAKVEFERIPEIIVTEDRH